MEVGACIRSHIPELILFHRVYIHKLNSMHSEGRSRESFATDNGA